MKAFSTFVIKNKLFSHLRQLFVIGTCCCTIREPARFVINDSCGACFSSGTSDVFPQAGLWHRRAGTAVSRQRHPDPRPGPSGRHRGAASSFLHCVLLLPTGRAGWHQRYLLWEQQGHQTTGRGEALTSFKMLPNVDVSVQAYHGKSQPGNTRIVSQFYTQVFVVVPISRLLFTVLSNNLKLS